MTACVECALVGGEVGGLRYAIALRQAGILVDPVGKQSERRVLGAGIVRQATAVRPEITLGVANEAARRGWPLSADQVVEDAVMLGDEVGGRSYSADLLRRWKSRHYLQGLWPALKALRSCCFKLGLPDDNAQFGVIDVMVEARPRSMALL